MNVQTKVTTDIRKQFYHFFPGGHTNLKAIPEGIEITVDRAEGTKLWDTEGNEYIDFACGYGPNILGHRHPEYIASLKQLMDTNTLLVGGCFGFTENDVALAKKLTQHVPSAELVKLTTSGSEAIQVAMRIARAYTGRPYVLQFQGHYHGWLDNTFGPYINEDPSRQPFAVPGNKELGEKATLGRGPGALDGTMVLNWNDIQSLENTLAAHGDKIAMILMEAYPANSGGQLPLPGYLERVRELCDQYGIVLCFDEVQSGFRGRLDCVQGLFGVTPDLTTLGKGLGGGMPISAVVGKAKVMDILRSGETIAAGTYMGQFLSVKAALITLQILERDNGAAYATMEKIQQRLMSGLDEIARRRDIPARIQGITGTFGVCLGADPDKPLHTLADVACRDVAMTRRLWLLLKNEGIYNCSERWFLNIAHTEKDVDVALQAADRAMAKL